MKAAMVIPGAESFSYPAILSVSLFAMVLTEHHKA